MAQDMLDSLEYGYGRALLEIADESNQLDAIADEVRQVQTLLAEQPGLRALLASQVLSSTERAEAIRHLFEGKLTPQFYAFLQVANDKNRLDQIDDIFEAFTRLLAEQRGEMTVDAWVATELDADLVSEVASKIGETFGKRVAVNQHVDASLVGGLKIRVGDRLLDGSVVTQLKLVKEKLIAAGREQARSGRAIQE